MTLVATAMGMETCQALQMVIGLVLKTALTGLITMFSKHGATYCTTSINITLRCHQLISTPYMQCFIIKK